ncbi:MAG: 3-dehydroquinate dehydratase [Syntrophorhabdus sp. PtaU1.Bin058]|nr:MAG: 3-dehydroquinate dehydratase [Syntrophorhabdus sp. PtaU1.Bin058]
MICVSIAESTAGACLEALAGLAFAEIRMDRMEELTVDDVRDIFSIGMSAGVDLVATCRPGAFSEDERKQLLVTAIESGAAYVDIEEDSDGSFKREIIAKARPRSCAVIVSFHDYEGTPEREDLLRIVSRCFESGGDIAKIACMVNSERDSARLLGLLDSGRDIIVIGMGGKGRITRIVAPLLGSPFTYAAPARGRETADGQLDRETLERYLKLLPEDGSGESTDVVRIMEIEKAGEADNG